jgi:putative molybdopterin biosynthesis protein
VLDLAASLLRARDPARTLVSGPVGSLGVAPGNPLGVSGLGDLPRLRYVNRQRGAGTRVLLDHELGRAGIEPASIDGYEREEPTHLAVAAAVAAGRADAGLGVMSAARAFGLGFVPVAREPFDLVMRPDEPAVEPLLTLLEDAEFRAQVEAMGGYSTADTGRRVA